MGKVYALSDLHGQGNLWEQIKTFLKPDDMVYFLGDAIDRGPNGFAIMKEILLDHRFHYIRGNHEVLMREAIKHNKWNDAWDLWFYNGGELTAKAWRADGGYLDWIYVINEMPLEMTYINTSNQIIHLSHAGFAFNYHPSDEEELIWDRKHFYDQTTPPANEFIVHGHSPIPYLEKKLYKHNYTLKDGVLFYADNHKIDIDNGCFHTHAISLLNLDTFDVIQFKE